MKQERTTTSLLAETAIPTLVVTLVTADERTHVAVGEEIPGGCENQA